MFLGDNPGEIFVQHIKEGGDNDDKDDNDGKSDDDTNGNDDKKNKKSNKHDDVTGAVSVDGDDMMLGAPAERFKSSIGKEHKLFVTIWK